MPEFRLPGPADRTWIAGHTGSGKSHAALWLLSHQDYDRRPWIVLDFKGENLIGGVPRIGRLRLTDRPPRRPGVYRLRYNPGDEPELEDFLWKVWQRGNIGIVVDEGHALPGDGGIRSDVVKALASQGRSKRIPMIVVSQRPAWISKFVTSQSDYIWTFKLSHRDDYKAIGELIPGDIMAMVESLPDRHFIAHDVAKRATFHLLELPGRDSIYDRFDRRLPPSFWIDLPKAQRKWNTI
jgi:hypothetical protein